MSLGYEALLEQLILLHGFDVLQESQIVLLRWNLKGVASAYGL
jgi:hypothetical protein